MSKQKMKTAKVQLVNMTVLPRLLKAAEDVVKYFRIPKNLKEREVTLKLEIALADFKLADFKCELVKSDNAKKGKK